MFRLKMIFTDDCDLKTIVTKILEFPSDYILDTENYAYRNFADPNIVHIKGCRLVWHNGY